MAFGAGSAEISTRGWSTQLTPKLTGLKRIFSSQWTRQHLTDGYGLVYGARHGHGHGYNHMQDGSITHLSSRSFSHVAGALLHRHLRRLQGWGGNHKDGCWTTISGVGTTQEVGTESLLSLVCILCVWNPRPIAYGTCNTISKVIPIALRLKYKYAHSTSLHWRPHGVFTLAKLRITVWGWCKGVGSMPLHPTHALLDNGALPVTSADHTLLVHPGRPKVQT